MVRGSRVAERDARMGCNDLDGQVLVGDIGAYLLTTPQAGEYGHCGSERDQPRLCEPGRDAEHVLLGNSHVEEPVRKRICKMYDGGCFGKGPR